jgi:PAS domain S-box-containing protein
MNAMEQNSAVNPNPVLSVVKDGTVIYSNEAGEPLLHEWDVNIGEKLPSYIRDIVHRVISLNRPERMEVKVGKRVFAVAFYPITDEEHVNIYGFDISDFRESEENLQKSENPCEFIKAVNDERHWLYDVLDSLPVMICILTSDHKVAFANCSFRKKYGDPGNQHCYEYCFGRTTPCEFCNSFKVLETGIPNNQEVTNTDGSVIEVYNLPFTDVDGSPMILKMKIDITERKKAEEKLRESEEKYRNIVETANEGMIIIDDKAIVTFANNKIMDMFGYDVEEGIGRSLWDYISDENRAVVEKNVEKWLDGIIDTYELKLTCKDGSSLWVLINSKPLFDKDGKYIGIMGMLTDITKRKEAEETIKNIEIARKKEIHHRIKNNLQVISSLLDLQAEKFRDRKDILDSEVLDAFIESQNRVASMALIHEELHKGGNIDTLNVSSYIKELSENLLQTYSVGNNDISLKIDLVENEFFDMDTAVPLGIIINELVSNSFKHAFKGKDEGEIQIKLHREGCNSITYVLSILDNGIGIPKDFDIEDLDSLGIQLVNTLVNQLSGELEMKRESGTEFIIRFKVTEKNPASAP